MTKKDKMNKINIKLGIQLSSANKSNTGSTNIKWNQEIDIKTIINTYNNIDDGIKPIDRNIKYLNLMFAAFSSTYCIGNFKFFFKKNNFEYWYF